MKNKPLTVAVVMFTLSVLVLTACQPAPAMPQTGIVPVGRGFAEGEVIYFTHTEASDPGIATLLTDMMDSPVLLVPALAEVPESALANVFVFENGLTGMGPLGFQPDVFDNPPGSEGYSPLRAVTLVSWVNADTAREITSVMELIELEQNGEVVLTQPGVVINMPFITWAGGER